MDNAVDMEFEKVACLLKAESLSCILTPTLLNLKPRGLPATPRLAFLPHGWASYTTGGCKTPIRILRVILIVSLLGWYG